MPLITLVVAVLLAALVGFVGIAVVSTPVGEYGLVAAICAIATYWLSLASDHHGSAH